MASLPYFLIFVFPIATFLGFLYGGAFCVLTPVLAFVVTPLLDWFCGNKVQTLTDEAFEELEHSVWFKVPCYTFVPVQIGLMLYALLMVMHQTFSFWEWCGLALSMGIVTGAGGINISHELMHKRSRVDQFLAHCLLLSVSYLHFYIEHRLGHHAKVATQEDPATAREGESLYAFLPRTVIGSYVSAWQCENKRTKKIKGIRRLLRNKMVGYFLLTLSVPVIITYLFNVNAALFFLVQSAVAITLLEIINYVEHYGLVRKKNNSSYEQVSAMHAWNASHKISNLLLFKLMDHSYHHIHHRKPYQALRPISGAPELPYGYPLMLMLALFPPIWKRIMHPRLKKLNQAEA